MRKLMIVLFLTFFSVSFSFAQGDLGQETSQVISITGDETNVFRVEMPKNSGFFELMLFSDTLSTALGFAPDAIDIKYVGVEEISIGGVRTFHASLNDTVTIATDTTLTAGLMNFEVNGLEEFDAVDIIIDADSGDTLSLIIKFKYSRN